MARSKKSTPGKPDDQKKEPFQKSSGLIFPVGRLNRLLRQSRPARPISGDAAPYLAAVLEYLTFTILEKASDCMALDETAGTQEKIRAFNIDDESPAWNGDTKKKRGVKNIRDR